MIHISIKVILVWCVLFRFLRIPFVSGEIAKWKPGYVVPRPLPEDIMVDTVNYITLILLHAHSENNENNIAISPYGATSVLVAVTEGVKGIALEEILRATFLPFDMTVTRIGLRDMHRHLQSYFVPQEGFLAGLTFNHENITLKPSYIETIRFYGYDVKSFNKGIYSESGTTTSTTTQSTDKTTMLTETTTESATESTVSTQPTDESTSEMMTTINSETTTTSTDSTEETRETTTTDSTNTDTIVTTTETSGKNTNSDTTSTDSTVTTTETSGENTNSDTTSTDSTVTTTETSGENTNSDTTSTDSTVTTTQTSGENTNSDSTSTDSTVTTTETSGENTNSDTTSTDSTVTTQTSGENTNSDTTSTDSTVTTQTSTENTNSDTASTGSVVTTTETSGENTNSDTASTGSVMTTTETSGGNSNSDTASTSSSVTTEIFGENTSTNTTNTPTTTQASEDDKERGKLNIKAQRLTIKLSGQNNTNLTTTPNRKFTTNVRPDFSTASIPDKTVGITKKITTKRQALNTSVLPITRASLTPIATPSKKMLALTNHFSTAVLTDNIITKNMTFTATPLIVIDLTPTNKETISTVTEKSSTEAVTSITTTHKINLTAVTSVESLTPLNRLKRFPTIGSTKTQALTIILTQTPTSFTTESFLTKTATAQSTFKKHSSTETRIPSSAIPSTIDISLTTEPSTTTTVQSGTIIKSTRKQSSSGFLIETSSTRKNNFTANLLQSTTQKTTNVPKSAVLNAVSGITETPLKTTTSAFFIQNNTSETTVPTTQSTYQKLPLIPYLGHSEIRPAVTETTSYGEFYYATTTIFPLNKLSRKIKSNSLITDTTELNMVLPNNKIVDPNLHNNERKLEREQTGSVKMSYTENKAEGVKLSLVANVTNTLGTNTLNKYIASNEQAAIKKEFFINHQQEVERFERGGLQNSPVSFSIKRQKAKNVEQIRRRHIRSIVDFLIARYYDVHPTYSSLTYGIGYEPPLPTSFLVNTKFREPNIKFLTYDTVLPFRYISRLNSLALTFPLDNTKFYLLLLLPTDEMGLENLITNILSTTLKQIVYSLQPTRVKAIIPNFMLKGAVTLTPTLQKLGIRQIFEPGRADFSRMTDDKNIYVTNIEQAVTITISDFINPSTSQNDNHKFRRRGPVQFTADHPFLYFVMDSEIHVALMAGKIVNPSNSRIR